ncbi:hypothetical protein [Paractinoplanes rishiriensis]|uniref:Uncharacterized protein n=1 Tax=Paractinoplanes rishiriensis TaxID=1050105 RepID=A0A919K260_9ACTN|nr:hypothetical protein [Actinoplanes rishiriensis]GIE97497.1 hypothetical protein Ari01nite_49620 [Actinoplanes rishiriensis]
MVDLSKLTELDLRILIAIDVTSTDDTSEIVDEIKEHGYARVDTRKVGEALRSFKRSPKLIRTDDHDRYQLTPEGQQATRGLIERFRHLTAYADRTLR